MADEARRIALAKAHEDMQLGALVVAIERAGGTLTYSATEYEAIAERFGGRDSIGIEIRAETGPDGPSARLTLVRRSPDPGTKPPRLM